MSSSSRRAAERRLAASVADTVAWRRYGHDVVAMDAAARVSHILRGDAARAFLGVAQGSGPPADDAEARGAIRELARRRIVCVPEGVVASGPPPVTVDAPVETETVLFAWASRNRVPLAGSLEVTAACNLRCRHCYCTPTGQHALDTKQMTGIIDAMAEAGALSITVTGGEVFLRPDWREILRHLDDRHFSFRINTNGVLLDESAAAELGRLRRLREVHVSIYSGDAAVHDRITGVRGSQKLSIRALELLRAAGVPVMINCSVMRTNHGTFHTVKSEIGDPMGIGVRYDPRIVLRHDGNRDNLSERLSTAELRDYYERRLDHGLDAAEFLNPKRRVAGHDSPCSAGSSYFAVAEDGTLYPCFQLRLAVGNLLETPFAELWRSSPVLEALRSTTVSRLPRCAACARLSYCNLCIGMGQSENGDPLSPADENCRDSAVRMELAVGSGILHPKEVPKGGQTR